MGLYVLLQTDLVFTFTIKKFFLLAVYNEPIIHYTTGSKQFQLESKTCPSCHFILFKQSFVVTTNS